MTEALEHSASVWGEQMTRNVALIYVRVSRLDRDDRKQQLEHGDDAKLRALSPATQIAQCKAMPPLQGMKVEVLEDLHRSGKNMKRPGLDRLRERLQDDDVAVVAVWSISRLGRSVADLYELLEEIQAEGVAFVSAKESIDTSTAYGRGFVGILAVLAQMEREITSERLAANWEQVARDGGLIGPVPFGYLRDAGVVTIDEPAAKLVRLIFRQYASGRYSYRELADWLNENGHRPPNADGRHRNGRPPAEIFVTDALEDILRNTRYAGRVVYRPRKNRDATPILGQYPAIVDDMTWRASAAMRAQNAAHNGLHYKRTARYALTGLLRSALRQHRAWEPPDQARRCLVLVLQLPAALRILRVRSIHRARRAPRGADARLARCDPAAAGLP